LFEQSQQAASTQVVKLLEEALKRRPQDGESHYLLGTVLAQQDQYERAAHHLERSIALSPKNPLPHYRLARVYLKLGRKEEALRERQLHQQLSEEQQDGAAKP
jgi:Flp pilus assembly protein TadD